MKEMEAEPVLSKTEKGYETEKEVIKILKSFACVTRTEIDRYDACFDVRYRLKEYKEDKEEDFDRCLQVKTLYNTEERPDEYSFSIRTGYPEGMLIVGLKYQSEPKYGLIHHYERKDGYGTKYVSLKPSSKARYQAMEWGNFLRLLERCLYTGLPLTEEFIEKSMTTTSFQSYKSHKRFEEFAMRHNLSLDWYEDPSSNTDLRMNQFKLRLMYSGIMMKGRNSYCFSLSTQHSKKSKFFRGDNDFYVFEIGEHHGDFLFIPEDLLLNEKNVIKKMLLVFSYNIESRKSVKAKGNFTNDLSRWFSTERGCLGSDDSVITHVENLFSSFNEEQVESMDIL